MDTFNRLCFLFIWIEGLIWLDKNSIYNNEFPNGKLIDFTPEEETARDTAEKAWSDGELDRRLKLLRKERNGLFKRNRLLCFSGCNIIR